MCGPNSCKKKGCSPFKSLFVWLPDVTLEPSREHTSNK